MSILVTVEYFQEQMATLGLKSSFSPTAYALDTLIVEASDWVEGYTDRKFALQTVTESLYGPRRIYSKLVLDNFPIVSITSVDWEDSLGMTGAIDVSRLRVRPGGVVEWKTGMAYGAMNTGAWYPELYYTVVYRTGYQTIPSNVQRATALKIANLIQPQYQGVQEREIYMVSNIEGMIVDLLEPFRRERFG